MRIVITDFLAEGTCEFSGKTSECLKIVLDANTPPAVVSTSHFIKLVRFHAQQEAKRAAQPQQPSASPRTQCAGKPMKRTTPQDNRVRRRPKPPGGAKLRPSCDAEERQAAEFWMYLNRRRTPN